MQAQIAVAPSVPGRDRSAEDQCVSLLARGTSTRSIDTQLRALLNRPLAWSTLHHQAQLHGVEPLVSRNLARLGWPGVPEDVRAQLELNTRRNAARNALLSQELGQLLAGCRTSGVPAIPLKGVMLAERLYGNLTLRQSCDIDLLVPPRAVANVLTLLRARGYEPVAETPLDPGDHSWLLTSMSACTFGRQHQGFRYFLDLHWHVAWRWPREAAMRADMWREARTVPFQGGGARSLSPEWDLLFLAVHGARHRWQALKWLVDVHEICERGGVDWQRVRAKARSFGLERVLALTMGACHAVLGTAVPKHLPSERPPAWLPLFPHPPAAPEVWADSLFPARLFDHRRQRLDYLARLVFAPTLQDRAILRLPPALDGIYFVVRPSRLAAKLGRRLLGHGAHAVRGAWRTVAEPS